MSAIPQTPIVNAGNVYVNGLNVGWGSNSTITITQGLARDSLNVNDIILGTFDTGSPLWTNIAATIDGDVIGANGMDRAVAAVSTRYSVFVIGDSTGYHPSAGLLSPSSNNPILPLGYDMFRRIGVVATDGSAHFLKISQYGQGLYRTNFLDVGINVLTAGNATSFTELNLEGLAKAFPSIPCKAYLKVNYTPASATNIAHFLPFGSTATNGIVVFGTGVAGAQQGIIEVPTAGGPGASSILYKVSNAGDSLTLDVIGFDDYLYGAA